MSEYILSNKELENATKLMEIAIENLPLPKTYTKEEQDKLIDSLLKSLNRLKEEMYSSSLDENHVLLFHGAKKELIGNPSIFYSEEKKDFGKGFYR